MMSPHCRSRSQYSPWQVSTQISPCLYNMCQGYDCARTKGVIMTSAPSSAPCLRGLRTIEVQTSLYICADWSAHLLIAFLKLPYQKLLQGIFFSRWGQFTKWQRYNCLHGWRLSSQANGTKSSWLAKIGWRRTNSDWMILLQSKEDMPIPTEKRLQNNHENDSVCRTMHKDDKQALLNIQGATNEILRVIDRMNIEARPSSPVSAFVKIPKRQVSQYCRL